MSQGNALAGISFGLDSDKVFKYRDKAMCNRWTTDYASFLMCDVKIMHNPIGNYIVNGKLKAVKIKIIFVINPVLSLIMVSVVNNILIIIKKMIRNQMKILNGMKN